MFLGKRCPWVLALECMLKRIMVITMKITGLRMHGSDFCALVFDPHALDFAQSMSKLHDGFYHVAEIRQDGVLRLVDFSSPCVRSQRRSMRTRSNALKTSLTNAKVAQLCTAKSGLHAWQEQHRPARWLPRPT